MKPIIATDYHGRTIMGIKGQDENDMWKKGDTLWGQKINARHIKVMEDETMEGLEFFRMDCDSIQVTFASDEAVEQYDNWCENTYQEPKGGQE